VHLPDDPRVHLPVSRRRGGRALAAKFATEFGKWHYATRVEAAFIAPRSREKWLGWLKRGHRHGSTGGIEKTPRSVCYQGLITITLVPTENSGETYFTDRLEEHTDLLPSP
jgi:hypothetical protein